MSVEATPGAGGHDRRNAPFRARLVELFEASDKSLREIAGEMGYNHANIVSMFKKGDTRVPLVKVPDLARVLHQDEGEMVRLWVDSYMPDVRPILERAFGTTVSDVELAWLRNLRKILGGPVPAFDDDAVDALGRYAARRRLRVG